MKPKMHNIGAKLSKSPLSLCLAILGVAFIVTGLVCYLFLMHTLINKIIAKKIAITEGSETYEKWRQIPMPIYYRYYFFNVSNAAEIERTGAKPVVKEIGPFTYRSKWTKSAITFYDNDTVSFRERKVLTFVPELSVASDTERILTTVNGPLSVTLALLQKAPLVVRNIVSLGLSTVTEGFFVKRSAKELLYDGYPEMLTSFGPLLNPSIPNTKGRFAWLYGKNNSDDGLFTVFTGQQNIRHLNQIDRFNGLAELPYWKPGSECNRLQHSTDGQIVVTDPEEKSFHLFHPEICRKIRFIVDEKFNMSQFPSLAKGNVARSKVDKLADNTRENLIETSANKETEIKFPLERYIPDPDTFSSVDEYSPNECYLSKITPSRPELGDLLVTMRQTNQNVARFPIRPFSYTRNGRVHFKSGVFDMSTCKYGAPVLLSFPHFLHAHDSFRDNINGLKPDPDKHQFSMVIEPRTGTSIVSNARFQINVFISKPPWVSRFRYIPEVVFPVFWQELHAVVPSDVVEHINWALTTPFTIADILSLSLIVIGLCIVTKSAFLMLCGDTQRLDQVKDTNLNTNKAKDALGSDTLDLPTLSNSSKKGFINVGLNLKDEEDTSASHVITPASAVSKGTTGL